MKIKQDYECFRCGYSTFHRNAMRKHFERKRVCPSLKNKINLTDTIKEYILDNRIYHIEEETILSQVAKNDKGDTKE